MTTQPSVEVISGSRSDEGIPAVDASAAAGITYRQLDHWARQGWVQPSVDPGRERYGKRLYSVEDVIRLDLLRHLAQSRVNVAVAGPAVASAAIPDGDIRVLWGPVPGRGEDEPGLRCVAVSDALIQVEMGGAWVVYNPADVRRRISLVAPAVDVQNEPDPRAARPNSRRRSA